MVTAKWYVIIYFLGAVYIYLAWLMTQLVRWKSGKVFTNFPYWRHIDDQNNKASPAPPLYIHEKNLMHKGK